MQNNIVLKPALVTAAILMIPLIAMQFTKEVNWGREDFIVMGGLIFGTSILLELVARKVRNKNYKILLSLGLVFGLLWLWVELAVGLFTNWGG